MIRMLARGFFAGTFLLGLFLLVPAPRRPAPLARREDDITEQVWDLLAEARRITEEAC